MHGCAKCAHHFALSHVVAADCGGECGVDETWCDYDASVRRWMDSFGSKMFHKRSPLIGEIDDPQTIYVEHKPNRISNLECVECSHRNRTLNTTCACTSPSLSLCVSFVCFFDTMPVSSHSTSRSSTMCSRCRPSPATDSRSSSARRSCWTWTRRSSIRITMRCRATSSSRARRTISPSR